MQMHMSSRLVFTVNKTLKHRLHVSDTEMAKVSVDVISSIDEKNVDLKCP